MTLAELHAMRLKGYRPAGTIWLTDNSSVAESMTDLGCSVILADETEDLKPLKSLPVVAIVDSMPLTKSLLSAGSNVLWKTGFYGWRYTMRECWSELCNS